MLSLANGELTVDILDPVADQERLGARYCSGGYVFQIHDRRLGPLLSGPSFPNGFHPFGGQGLPEAFSEQPLRAVGSPSEALILGVGVCELNANRFKTVVKARAEWRWQVESHQAVFSTQQALGDWALELTRTVTLSHRTVRSSTRVANRGQAALPLRWFPHPFFPQPQGDSLCKLSCPLSFPEDEAYALTADGFITRRGWPWAADHYQTLDHAAAEPLVVLQRHPKVGLVTGRTSYVPGLLPIWGNAATFSWEPFLERTVAPGRELSWWIEYDF